MTLAIAGVVSLSLVATACSDDEPDDGDATPAATSAATSIATGGAATPEGTATSSGQIDISGVPELEDGVLSLGSDLAYAPMESLDQSGAPVGVDIDLAKALGAILGVDVAFNNEPFAALLSSLTEERHDAVMSAMRVTEERALEADFVEYFTTGTDIIVPSGNPAVVETVEDFCGLRIGVQEETIQLEYLESSPEAGGGLSEACVDAGEEEPVVLQFPSTVEAVQSLVAGQADAVLADYPVATDTVAQASGAIETVGAYQFDQGNYGIATRKTSTALTAALQVALDAIIADGTYAAILAEWGLGAGALQ